MTAIFPSLPGLSWNVIKQPRFATRIQRAVSGRELRVLDQPAPSWNWTLTYDFLRDGSDPRGVSGGGLRAAYDELRGLMGFFLQQQGAFQPFLFDDPTDNAVTAQPIGIGNASTRAFQLVRTMGSGLPGGGFAEPITAPHAVSNVYLDGIRQSVDSYSVDPDTGIVSFVDPPTTARTVTVDFTYYFRVRFADDSAEFENFMMQLWSLKQIKLQTAFL